MGFLVQKNIWWKIVFIRIFFWIFFYEKNYFQKIFCKKNTSKILFFGGKIFFGWKSLFCEIFLEKDKNVWKVEEKKWIFLCEICCVKILCIWNFCFVINVFFFFLLKQKENKQKVSSQIVLHHKLWFITICVWSQFVFHNYLCFISICASSLFVFQLYLCFITMCVSSLFVGR